MLEANDELLKDLLTQTGLDLKGVMNEAFTIYEKAVEARAEGNEIGIIDEKTDTHHALRTPGLDRIQPRARVEPKPGDRMANDTGAKATLEIGAVALAGEHKGEIYGGILPTDNKPIWFLAAPKSMDNFNAASWAYEQGGALPTRKQGDYLTTLKGKGGAFTELFNRGGSFPAGYVWLAEPDTGFRVNAWCQRLSDGDQGYLSEDRSQKLPVLCVRR
jgi:hypothetical protein